ncbi:MAG: phenylacetate--CoA ligase family protein [Candidatus Cryptobacteroides sp.]
MIMDIEFSTPQEIKAFQEEKLATALQYLKANSPYYKRMFAENNIDIDKVRHIEDLVSLPFTAKKDLQLYNWDFLCCDRAKVVDYVTTSGTLGEPVTFACTEKDLQRLAYNEKKSFACAGLKPGNILQLMTTIDKRFMAGLAYFLGIRELGASIIRVGNGIPELQWDTIERLKPDAIMCVPSFILKLIQYAEEHGIDYKASSVRKIIGIGEGLRDQNFELNLLGRRIKEKWDVELYATYSSTEMGATFSECEYGCGGHVHPELIIVEIIGEDDKPVADGEVGEIVVTTLGVEGMPLLRFRTGDMAAKRTEQCKCGRWSYRLTPLVGRKNNMIKFKGTTLYPPMIVDVLDNCRDISNYQLVLDVNDIGNDDVTVRIGLPCPDPEKDALLVAELKNTFRAKIRVAPNIEICRSDLLAKEVYKDASRKPLKVVDRRPKN